MRNKRSSMHFHIARPCSVHKGSMGRPSYRLSPSQVSLHEFLKNALRSLKNARFVGILCNFGGPVISPGSLTVSWPFAVPHRPRNPVWITIVEKVSHRVWLINLKRVIHRVWYFISFTTLVFVTLLDLKMSHARAQRVFKTWVFDSFFPFTLKSGSF